MRFILDGRFCILRPQPEGGWVLVCGETMLPPLIHSDSMGYRSIQDFERRFLYTVKFMKVEIASQSLESFEV